MLTEIDLKILNAIQQLRTPFLDGVFAFVTHLGDAGIIWIVIAVVLLFFKKTRKCGVVMAISLIIGLLLNNILLKNIFARVRPFIENPQMKELLLIAQPHGYSFPSGHSSSSFECAVAICLSNKKYGVAALIFAALIAFSRCYLYVHYLTDILAGAVIGILIALLSEFIFNRFIKNKRVGSIDLNDLFLQ